ncbi:MAG TPA: excinuclease ABC subunit UvrB [Planctomycetota bacterium]|nr:excinuclease ABC subunit UvrB [Planctomycetota bacterium]
MAAFDLRSKLEPCGDQPQAIEALVARFRAGAGCQTLLGVTGSGKTFTMAHVVARLGLPTLIISHNKTLAAQLYSEFRDLFPNNAVEYFVSYYDYFQPEAYIPSTDTYIEKDASINDDLDRLRLAATSAVLSRRDVIIVASVSCIYGLGSPADYEAMTLTVRAGQEIERDEMLRKLVDIQYDRNDFQLQRGHFRARGDSVEVSPAYQETAYRIEFQGDEVDRLVEIEPLSGRSVRVLDELTVFPARHFVLPQHKLTDALGGIEAELEERLADLRKAGKLIEAQRLEARTRYDLAMLSETGFCPGIENYSRHLSGRAPGSRPWVLIDYFPSEFLTIVDESHVAIPQVQGMYGSDRSRKVTLVEHGFRLPSALDNRPLKFDEWEGLCSRVFYVSATPGPYELGRTKGEVVQQVIRPTGLVDPAIAVRPARGQVEDLLGEIRKRVERKERVLVTTLTKRLAEDISDYILEEGYRCRYLHSEIETIERVEILRDLRKGEFDVLVGVNLLREGLDLPEVALVAILDADKEGFLRSATSLIQMIGRAARNVNSEVILYGEAVTDSMRRAIEETDRRRAIQLAHNREHGITPRTVRKEILRGIQDEVAAHRIERDMVGESEERYVRREQVREMEQEMLAAAEVLDFERAAALRDRIYTLEGRTAELVKPQTSRRPYKRRRKGRRKQPWE